MKFRDLKFGEHFLLNEKEYICSRSLEDPYVKCVSKDLQVVIDIGDDQEVTKLNSYRIAGQYTKVFEVEVYSDSLDNAIKEVEKDYYGTYVNVGKNFLDGSFSVNREVTESLNKPELEPDFE